MDNKLKVKTISWVKGLDSIRFILASVVVLSHFANPWVDYFKQSTAIPVKAFGMLLPNLFSGIGAVIAFFIISGFVIHYPNKDKMPNVVKFLVRRWLRIGLPLIVIVLIAVYYNSFDRIPIWSLYCELIYYTIYPLLLKIKASWKTKFITSFIISFVLIFLFCKNDIASFIHYRNINYIGAYWQLGPFATWIIGLPCWLLGVLLAENIDTISTSISGKKIIFLRLLVFGISVLINIAKFHFFLSFILSMNLFALILFVWLKAEILYYRENTPVSLLEKMGAFSYSLYLIHALCFKMLLHFFRLTNLSYFIFIFITVAVAYLFYLTIEKPSHLIAKKIASKIGVKQNSNFASDVK